jgi:hypothetical protein
MRRRDNFLARYYERATIDQLVEEYKGKGYFVQREVRLGNFRIDLTAEKDGQKLLFEVTRGRQDAMSRKRIEGIEEMIRNLPNTRLIIVPARYEEEKEIEFNGIETVLQDYFLEVIPDELDELSTHTRIEGVDSVVVDAIKIYGQDIIVKCSGQVSVSLQYGSDSEQDGRPSPMMSFPFELEGTVSWKSDGYEVSEVDNLRVDTGEFYK